MDPGTFLNDLEPEDLFSTNGNVTIKPQILLSKIDVSKKTLNIIHLNIRGITTNYDNLIIFLETFKIKFCDILILSECHKIGSERNFNIPGYSLYYDEGNFNAFDGILIYTKNYLNVKICSLKLPTSYISLTKINLKINDVSYNIYALYRSPSSSVVMFLNDLEEFLDQDSSQDVNIVIGDLNLNIRNNNDHNINKYLSIMNSKGFLPMYKNITRPDSGSCLDHIFLKEKSKTHLCNFSGFVIDFDITDHYACMLNVSNSNERNITQNTQNFIKILDYDRLVTLAHEVDWNLTMSYNDTQEATEYLVNTLKTIVTNSETTKIIKNKYKKLKSWITNAIITSIRNRDKMKMQLRHNSSPEKIIQYKNYRNKLNKIINITKNSYYNNEIMENKTNLKKVYKIVSEATNEKEKTKNENLKIFNDNNLLLLEDKEIADYTNNFFVSIGQEMANKIKKPAQKINTKTSNSSMFLSPVQEEEILKYIGNLKNNCSAGIDKISTKVIKILHIFLIKPLCHIINRIFITGKVPDHFKTSIVTPVYKNSGSKENISNYRPISVINNFAKVFEKSLNYRLYKFLVTNNILSPNQFGFIEKLSTTDAMYQLVKEVTKNLDNNKKTLAVFIDLAKAFDTVSHDQLLETLERYGARGTVSEVFESYLKDRKQYVKIGNSLSDPREIKTGVPQGTVLGPLLFNVYINALCNLDINGRILAYADDTVIIFVGDTWEEAQSLLKTGMDKVKLYLNCFKLTLNESKTNYIAFSLTSSNRPVFSEIKINSFSSPIKEVKNTKYLGIMVDCNLKWDKHCDYVCQKIRFLIHKFYLLRAILNYKLIITFYKTLVEPLLSYGIFVWGGAYNSNLESLKTIQNYIIKVMLRKPKLYSTRLIYNNDIINIRTIYICTICNYLYKNISKQQYVTHKYSTRSIANSLLNIPRSNKTINQRFVDYFAPKIFNQIPKNIREIKNFCSYKKKCRQYVTNNLNRFSFVDRTL